MKSKILQWYYDTPAYDFYRLLFVRIPERLKRSFHYAKFGWLNYDFDYSALHELTLFKLKRFLYCFENYGYHSEECENYKPKMKSLKLAIKLLEKYLADGNRFLDMHDKKWGPLETWTEKAEYDENYGQLCRWLSKRPGAITEEQKEQERIEFRNAYDADDREKNKYLALAYKIIIKYNRYWWD